LFITGEQFELTNGWDFNNKNNKDLIRDAGWALKSAVFHKKSL
jgi:hypothetical protein